MRTNQTISKIISSLRGQFKLNELLATLNFPKSTFMYWQKRFDRNDPDLKIKEALLRIRKQHENYGYRVMREKLKNEGFIVNKKKIQRLMRELDIRITAFTRKSRKYSSYKGKVGTIAPNRIKQRFDSNIIHQKITTDTTEFKYYEKDSSGNIQIKKLYLDPFMDLCNREVISFRISKKPNGETIMAALKEAIEVTNDCLYRRTFHSDQGWAYQMNAYKAMLKENNIFQSMSRKGNCYDNSPIENFFGILKQEIYYGNIFHSYKELKERIISYIHYYNHDRMKQKLNWLSPVEYRRQKLI